MTSLFDHPLLRAGPARRRLGDMALLGLVVLAGAAGLQLFWIGANPYNGPGPAVRERWFYSACLMATLVLVPWSAVRADRAWSHLRQQGILRQLQLTRLSPAAICAAALGTTLGPLLALVLASLAAWGALAVVAGDPPLPTILLGHLLVLVQVVALGLAGQALATLFRRSSLAGPLAALCLALCTTALFLAEPVLAADARLAWSGRPEWWIAAALSINPVTAVGAALGLDVLRTPWLYSLTSAPEYRFAYPSPWLTLTLYAAAALALGWRMCRCLRYE
jgi:hypothetical protein